PGHRRAAKAQPARRGDTSPWGEHPRIPSAKGSIRDAPPRILASGGGRITREGRSYREAREARALANLCYKFNGLTSLAARRESTTGKPRKVEKKNRWRRL